MGDTLGTVGKVAAGPMGWASLAGAGPEKAIPGLGGGGAPNTPDFTGAANEQSKQSKVDQSNPFFNSGWSQGPDGRWTQSTSLNGGLGEAAAGLQGQVGALGQPMDWSQFGKAGTGDQARDQAITSAYGQSTSRLDPMYAQQENALHSQLANQGLSEQDAAGQSALGNFGRQKNDAYTSALASAIGQGTAAGHTAFQDNLLSRQTSIADALRQREQPVSDLKNLQGFMTGAQSPGSAQGPNLLGALGQSYEGDLQKYGTQQAGKNSQMAGAASLAPLLL